MKNKFINYFAKALLITAFLGVLSCETETLFEEEQALELDATLSSEARKGKGKKTKGTSFDFSEDCKITDKTNLYAGQNILVGDVTVNTDGVNYVITYNITDSGYCLSETHLSVVSNPENFPMSGGGNPKNGHFEYKNSHDCVDSYSYVVPMSKGNYIAAHGVVNCVAESDSDDILNNLPSLVNLCITARGADAVDSYFDITINNTILSGDYDAWCIDVDLDPGTCYDADVYSSINDELPAGAFENPQNFDKVNWIMNQDFIGKTSQSGKTFTYGHVQWAIWELIDDNNCALCKYLTDPTGEWFLNRSENEALGMEIVQASLDNGEGFIPSCDELVSVILIPNDNTQPIFISIPVTCGEPQECEETVWGDGCDFPGNNWATYFSVSSGH